MYHRIDSFTNQARSKLYRLGLRMGQQVTFRYRRKGKLKKVQGRFRYFSHKPSQGFRIHLNQVKWLGRYWGGLTLLFKTRDIVWYVNDELPKMIEACLDP